MYWMAYETHAPFLRWHEAVQRVKARCHFRPNQQLTEDRGIDPIEQLVPNPGVLEEQCRGGAGRLFPQTREKRSGDEFAEAAYKVSGLDDRFSAAPNDAGGGLMGAVGSPMLARGQIDDSVGDRLEGVLSPTLSVGSVGRSAVTSRLTMCRRLPLVRQVLISL